MNCKGCPSYNHGRGTGHCLKCDLYQKIIMESGKRRSISMESVPEMVLDNIPSLPDEIRAIEKIPLKYSTPILQKFFLNATYEEIAKHNSESIGNVRRKIRFGIRLIRKIKGS